MTESLSALLVAYIFPPSGAAGVGRVLKLAKYLPQYGVRPAVLTVSNPSVPITDASGAEDIPPGMEIVRVPTLEPGYQVKSAGWSASEPGQPSLRKRLLRLGTEIGKRCLVPDAQILWQPAAQLALGLRLLRDSAEQVVFVTGPPFSQFLLAPLVRLRPRTAVVLDYRDEWSTYRSTYEMMSRLGGWVGDALEPRLIRCAHAITLATEEFRAQLLQRYSFLDPARVHAIPNGYDLDDIPSTLPQPPSDRFVVTYAGTLFRLTSAQGLLGAVRRLHRDEPALAKLLELRFIGRIVASELPFFEGGEALGIRRLGFVDHKKVALELGSSHLTLCLLDEVPGVERIYPAKIFELMALGRPCLVLAPQGALTRLVEQHGVGDVLPPRDEARIAAYLAAKLRAFREGTFVAAAKPYGIERYNRRALAGEFAQVFRQAVAAAQRR